MSTLDWLARDAAFRTAERTCTRVLRPHPALLAQPEGGHRLDDGNPDNLLV